MSDMPHTDFPFSEYYCSELLEGIKKNMHTEVDGIIESLKMMREVDTTSKTDRYLGEMDGRISAWTAVHIFIDHHVKDEGA